MVRRWISALLLLAGLGLMVYPAAGEAVSRHRQHRAIRDFRRGRGPESMVGCLTVERLGLSLPVYDNTQPQTLLQGAGLLEGTFFPADEESTHAVLAGHSGLPGARLFDDLARMTVGDRFRVTLADRELEFRVEQLLVVEPGDTAALAVEAGVPRCTLVTCTPRGINSHRLLVLGRLAESLP